MPVSAMMLRLLFLGYHLDFNGLQKLFYARNKLGPVFLESDCATLNDYGLSAYKTTPKYVFIPGCRKVGTVASRAPRTLIVVFLAYY
jgi:hypothetical protein